MKNAIWSLCRGRAFYACLAFFLLMVVLPVASIFITRIPGVLLPIAALLCIYPLAQAHVMGRLPRYFWAAIGMGVAVILAWGAYSPIGAKAMVAARSGMVMLVAGALLSIALPLVEQHRERLFKAMGISLLLTILLLLFEYATNGSINIAISHLTGEPPPKLFMLDRAIVGVTMLVWPVLCWRMVKGQGGMAWLVLPLLIALVFFTSSQSSLVGLLAGTLVFAVATFMPRQTLRVMQFAVPLVFLLMPFIAMAMHDVLEGYGDFWEATSSDIRLNIWYDVAQASLQAPLIGHGIEAARQLTILNNHYMHPHNGPLQIWYEFGLLGAAFAAWIFNRMVTRMATWPRPLFAIGQGALMCWLTIFSVSYNIWQLWWMALAILTWLLLCLAARPIRSTAA